MNLDTTLHISLGDPQGAAYGAPTGLSGLEQELQQIQQQEQQAYNPIAQGDGFNMGQPQLQQVVNLATQVLKLLEEMLAQQGQGGNEQHFNSVQGSDTGDPHLALNGQEGSNDPLGFFSSNNTAPTNGSGDGNVNSHWDDMNSEPDLLHSDSFGGGLQVSTQVTTPNGNGVTLNKSISINAGGDNVTVSGDGSVTINGESVNLSAGGQPIQLGNGESLSRGNDGKVHVSLDNGQGGTLDLALSAGGGHVDLNFSGQNVDLGGAMVDHATGEHTSGGYRRFQPEPPVTPENYFAANQGYGGFGGANQPALSLDLNTNFFV